MKVSSTGIITVSCIFHEERTPSLRIRKTGLFKCYGCGRHGHIRNHPELEMVVDRVTMQYREDHGQLRLFR